MVFVKDVNVISMDTTYIGCEDKEAVVAQWHKGVTET